MDETSVIDEEIVNDMFFAHQVSVPVTSFSVCNVTRTSMCVLFRKLFILMPFVYLNLADTKFMCHPCLVECAAKLQRCGARHYPESHEGFY